jgi:YhcH/YjgK/YiaL family protein
MEWYKSGSSQQHARKYDAFGREVQDDPADDTSPVVNTGLKPAPSIDKVEFAKDYHAYSSRWDKAFYFLQHTDFSTLGAGKYPIDGDDVYAVITIGPARSIDTTLWEAHRHYDDIHYVISGKEKIGVAPLARAKLKRNYDSVRDIAYYEAKGEYFVAEPGTFFIITTKEAHRPNLQTEGSGIVKKLFIKVRKD